MTNRRLTGDVGQRDDSCPGWDGMGLREISLAIAECCAIDNLRIISGIF